MEKLVLVPLDGASFGEQALPTAIAIAEKSHAGIELVHSYEPLPPPYVFAQGAPVPDTTLDVELRRDRANYLAATGDWVRQHTSVSVTTTILDGPIAKTLADHIEQRKPEVVVMTTHGRGGLTRLWLGSVAQHLMQHSNSPLLLIRPEKGGSRTQQPPAFQRILVPLDASAGDEEAIDHALEITGAQGVELTLVHVVVPLFFASVDPAMLYPDEAEIQRGAAKYLEEVADRLRARGLTVDARVERSPSVANAILECADDIKADFIALETHAYGKLTRVLTGSVADKVVRGAPVPVLVHRLSVEEDKFQAATQKHEGSRE